MRDYETLLAELHTRPRYAKKKDLHRIQALMAKLGDPQKDLRFVHIAGTNGKGSVSAMTASILRCAGVHAVGLFTSPYLKEFTERIQINGKMIPKNDFCRLYEHVYQAECALEAAGQDPANEFEIITAIAMLWFSELSCDWVVLEVGLGGRLDATNVIPPQKVCCITQLGLDHQAQLGSTLSEIAAEKAGIIKPESIVVTPATQAPEALAVLQSVCEKQGASLCVASSPEQIQLFPDKTRFSYKEAQYSVSLAGAHQAHNAACAIEIASALGISGSAIREGLLAVSWPGRLDQISAAPCVVLDCGHNPNGITALRKALHEVYDDRPYALLMAMMQDKDYERCVETIASDAVRFTATTLDMPRALSAENLKTCASSVCDKVCAVSDVCKALESAVHALQKDEMLVICGSVYLAGEILKILDEGFSFDKK